jgi:drug/metabolite transporter (DMT)-like permease
LVRNPCNADGSILSARLSGSASMPVWSFVPIALAAAALQTARNGLQRGLLDDVGPWGATLVRFLFGLPFALAWLAVAFWISDGRAADLGAAFWLCAAIGGLAQILATAAMLVAMKRTSFALGTAFQNASLPFSALAGLAFGDLLNGVAWAGIAAATVGLGILSWPRGGVRDGDWSGAGFGLFSGAAFAVSANMFREAGHLASPGHAILGAAVTLAAVQAIQTAGLAGYMGLREPENLGRAASAWRRSLGAGFFGAAASACWFTALAIAPAGAVRAIGVVDMPMAAWAGGRWFRETLPLRVRIGGALTAAGVLATALSLI